jgi:hypothetical protein
MVCKAGFDLDCNDNSCIYVPYFNTCIKTARNDQYLDTDMRLSFTSLISHDIMSQFLGTLREARITLAEVVEVA